MSVQLNHTIVWSSDPDAASRFLADILGLPEPQSLYHFRVVRTENAVSIDFAKPETREISPQHYAFLVSEDDFNGIFERIQNAKLDFWADPARRKPGAINTNDGGRGVYFEGPDGHLYEALTVPYGGSPA